jgi:hypothetical protein
MAQIARQAGSSLTLFYYPLMMRSAAGACAGTNAERGKTAGNR